MIIIIPNKSVRFVKKHFCPNVCIKAGASICLQEYKYTGREKSDHTTTATTYSSIACPPNEKYNLIFKDKTKQFSVLVGSNETCQSNLHMCYLKTKPRALDWKNGNDWNNSQLFLGHFSFFLSNEPASKMIFFEWSQLLYNSSSGIEDFDKKYKIIKTI